MTALTARTTTTGPVRTDATLQCYDVVAQVTIPSDFAGWDVNPIALQAIADNTSNTAIAVQVMNSGGTVDANYSYAAGSLTTSWSDIATSAFAGTYTSSSVMTIRIRLSAKSISNVKIGALTLNYKSKY